jgi:hypothetical protein
MIGAGHPLVNPLFYTINCHMMSVMVNTRVYVLPSTSVGIIRFCESINDLPRVHRQWSFTSDAGSIHHRGQGHTRLQYPHIVWTCHRPPCDSLLQRTYVKTP